MGETAAELPFIGDQVVCLSHDQAARSGPRKDGRASIPIGRYATPEEVANVVMYLCSDLANDITGTHIVIDGAARPGPAERCGASNNSSAIPPLVFLIAPAAARPETHNSIFRKTGLIG